MPAGHEFILREWARIYLVGVVLLIPLVKFQGPGQLTLLDPLNVIALGFFCIAAAVQKRRIRFPFLVPLYFILLGSLLAMINSPFLSRNALALAQDVYLYLWFILLVNIPLTKEDLDRLLLVWVSTSTLVALLAILGVVYPNIGPSGEFLALEGRAVVTFLNPNMLANYLVMSVFLTLAIWHRLRRHIAIVVLLVLIAGLVSSQSNGGVVSLAAGILALLTVWLFGENRSPLRIGVAASILASMIVALWLVAQQIEGDIVPTTITESRYAARAHKGLGSRLTIWTDLTTLYPHNPLGIGPASSGGRVYFPVHRGRPVQLEKEAHNDYLSYLVERGPLGLTGLISLTLYAGFLLLAGSSRIRRLPASLRKPSSAMAVAFLGALTATSVHSLSLEKLHFRHFWFLLAIIYSFHSILRNTNPEFAHPRGQPRNTGPAHAR